MSTTGNLISMVSVRDSKITCCVCSWARHFTLTVLLHEYERPLAECFIFTPYVIILVAVLRKEELVFILIVINHLDIVTHFE